MDYLPAHEEDYPGDREVTASVIWLHGLGSNGHDFPPIIPQLGVSRAVGIRFIFPHAPSMPVSINNGHVMPAWYDIKQVNLEREVDTEQLCASARRVHDLIDREIERGVPSERIIVSGFSQGGAVTYEAALTYPKKLGGIMAFSTYLATAETLQLNPVQNDIPILVCHGETDPVVPEALGRNSVQALNRLGLLADYKTYPMDHAVCPAEVMDIGRFINRVYTGREALEV
ncbi:MAG: dienelactone hydrolase family protein [Gammaproteobacteria bacterium]